MDTASTSRIIAHIDMNSYFASVEQQAHPALRGRPIAVTGPSKRSIVVAASIEAKKLGIKTGTQIGDALRICPDIILVKADCRKYEAISRQLFQIFINYSPYVEIFSVDEGFIDLTNIAVDFKQAEQIVQEIKQDIKEQIGGNIRCSAGIGTNKFIAKLASEAKKPDGLTTVLPGEEIKFVDRFELDDACGIGRRIKRHLNTLGVYSFEDLRAVSQIRLTLVFNSYGLKLYNIARGIDFDPIKPYFLQNAVKSISKSKTLARNTYDKDEISNVMLSFCQATAKDLKEKKLLAGATGLYLRYSDFSHSAQRTKIKTRTDSWSDLFFSLKKLLGQTEIKKPVRKIGIWTSDLAPDNGQLTLSREFSKQRDLERLTESINNKFGRKLLTPASVINLDLSPSPSYGFKKDLFDL